MNEITKLNQVFEHEGQALVGYLWEGAPVWIAKELGRVMGYADDGKALVDLFRKDWKEELIEGTDFEMLEGERLSLFKNHQATFSCSVDPRASHLLILKEPGFHLVCMKSGKPVGVRLRRWLATEVMPSLMRTGSYSTQSTGNLFEDNKAAILFSMLQKALKGNVSAAQFVKDNTPKIAPPPQPSPITRWWADCLSRGHINPRRPWADHIPCEEVLAIVRTEITGNLRSAGVVESKAIAYALRKLCPGLISCRKTTQVINTHGQSTGVAKQRQCYTFPSLEACRSAFALSQRS